MGHADNRVCFGNYYLNCYLRCLELGLCYGINFRCGLWFFNIRSRGLLLQSGKGENSATDKRSGNR